MTRAMFRRAFERIAQLGIWNSEFGIRSAIPNSKFSIPDGATYSQRLAVF
jgi:hypothetical protein